MEKHPKISKNYMYGVGAVLLVLLAVIGTGTYFFIDLKKEYEKFQADSATAQTTLEEQRLNLEAVLEITKQELALSEENAAELKDQLDDEKDRNNEFEDQIDDLTGNVQMLDKLSKLDPELLTKYSKVYFLNDNYVPERIAEIDAHFRFKTEEKEYIHAQIANELNDLLEDAEDDDLDLLVLSGYRSFDEQRSLKGAYTTIYGTGANAFSADQGYSEHQLGTTLDFTTTRIGAGLTGFDQTPEYAWLLKNAYKYGFVLSYPKNNAYYVFEPWHWRYVGKDLAEDLQDRGKHFYELTQREIDPYLIKIFD